MTTAPKQTKQSKPAGNGRSLIEQTGMETIGNGQAQMMMAMNGAAMETFSRCCQAYLTGVARMNSEIAGFMAKRLTHDAELSASLARCGSWEEAADLQRDWAREAAEEYAEEANRLVELASTVATEQWQPVWTSTEQAVSSMTKPAV